LNENHLKICGAALDFVQHLFKLFTCKSACGVCGIIHIEADNLHVVRRGKALDAIHLLFGGSAAPVIQNADVPGRHDPVFGIRVHGLFPLSFQSERPMVARGGVADWLFLCPACFNRAG